MAIRERTVERILGVMKSICTIRGMEYFYIGYSSVPANRRGGPAREGFQFMVVLADRLSKGDALDLEKRLFCAATQTGKKNLLYKKYHPDKRDKRYYPSDGGNKIPANKLVHSVYMVWC